MTEEDGVQPVFGFSVLKIKLFLHNQETLIILHTT
jgi:hypothetical protein